MALVKQKVVAKIEILEDGQLQIREDIVILEDGVEINRRFFRRVLNPGDDVTSESVRIRQVANLIWTQAVIDAYRAKVQAGRL